MDSFLPSSLPSFSLSCLSISQTLPASNLSVSLSLSQYISLFQLFSLSQSISLSFCVLNRQSPRPTAEHSLSPSSILSTRYTDWVMTGTSERGQRESGLICLSDAPKLRARRFRVVQDPVKRMRLEGEGSNVPEDCGVGESKTWKCRLRSSVLGGSFWGEPQATV